MQVIIKSPTKAYLVNPNEGELYSLRKELTYINTSHQHAVKRHYNNKWYRQKNPVAWEKELERLKSLVKNTLVLEDSEGYYIRPGSIPYILTIPIDIIQNLIKYKTPKKIPWQKPLPFELHPYQNQSVEKLIEEKHGNVELTTGAGKGACILKIARETGFNCAIVAPSKNIFLSLVDLFEKHLGKKYVGKFGNGTKKIGKKITVCIGDSLANIKEGSKEWEFFNSLDMLIIDESHLIGAETLEKMNHGVLGNIPYRFYFSGTQTRGDGAEILLQSIIGKTVHTLTTREAIEGGYICDHSFSIITVQTSDPYFSSQDPLALKRAHFLYNQNICSFITKLANADAIRNGRQTLILVDELVQASELIKELKVPYAVAHSETNKERLLELGFEKSSPEDMIELFNKGEVKVLIGTSCIQTGSNIYQAHNTVNWTGGSSWIKTAQGAVGRSVRKGEQNPYEDKCLPKTHCKIYDFDVREETMRRHLDARLEVYKQSGTEIKFIKLNP